MNTERARAALKKLERSYRTKLGLARRYAEDPSASMYGSLQSQKDKQLAKVEKYTEIVDALDFALCLLEESGTSSTSRRRSG